MLLRRRRAKASKRDGCARPPRKHKILKLMLLACLSALAYVYQSFDPDEVPLGGHRRVQTQPRFLKAAEWGSEADEAGGGESKGEVLQRELLLGEEGDEKKEGEEGEKKEGEEGEEEEEGPSPVACATSVMLMGSISFQMLLFYLVNHSDDDMRRYTWQVLSNTISIFSAVLMFQAVNKLVETHIIGESEEDQHTAKAVIVDVSHLAIWLIILQITLALTSGAMREYKIIGYFTGKNPEKYKIKECEEEMQSYSVLCAHLTGFAAINAWGSIQQVYLNESPFKALGAPAIGAVVLGMFLYLTDLCRETIATLGEGDSGDKDEFEELWDEGAEEAEDDVMALSLSFVTAQVLRFYFSGMLPNIEGQETEEGKDEESLVLEGSHGNDWAKLVCCGICFVVLTVFSGKIKEKYAKAGGSLERVIGLLNLYCVCGNAWCFFYGSKWLLCGLKLTDENAVLHVIMALFLSGISFGFIRLLDWIEDNQFFGEDSEEAIEQIIEALGLLVGFSWEQSFDVALDTITESCKSIPPNATRCGLSIFLVWLVVPAWKSYILPVQMQLAEKGTVAKRITYAEKYMKKYIDKNTSELDLDTHHLVLKRYRRHLIEEQKRSEKKKEEKEKEEEHEAPKEKEKAAAGKKHKDGFKHFIVTANGMELIHPNDLHSDAMLEKLLKSGQNEDEESGEEED